MNKTRELRKTFLANLIVGLRVVGPILSLITVSIGVLGIIIGVLEGWSISESIYFAFVTGLTVGYGDLVPKLLLTRVLAILVGFCGILLTSLVAAVAVKALGTTFHESNK